MGLNNYQSLGRILCKGSGLRAYLEVPLQKRQKNGTKEIKLFRYEIGNLQQIIAETNRPTKTIEVIGRKNSVSVSQGIRNTYGTIVFSQVDQGMTNHILHDVKKYNNKTKQFTRVSLNEWGLEDYTILEEDQALINGPAESLVTDLYETEFTSLEDLPPVNIVIYGTADNITDGKYETGKTYMFKLNKVTFMSETFGVSAGSPMHDVATKVLILGSIEPWKEVKNGELK